MSAPTERCTARRDEWLTQGPGMRGAGMGHGFYRVRCEKEKGHAGHHDNGYEEWPRRRTSSDQAKGPSVR